ncbi:MAG: DNA polymerase III subunit delta', partial [Ectothiorhodospiraceae bacterium]|nr:DNA polymerase III subunit delta' [Ectothiorhodospiraceae bacterium]
MTLPLPWQQSQWNDLLERARSDSLPHALLFTAPAGFGKATFAKALIHSLLCSSPQDEGSACGSCSACKLLAAKTHPDLFWVEPEEPGKAIPVDRIRAVGNFFALKSHYGGRQIVFIDPAEAMNRFSANSLLKTLEEPTDGALLILLSSQPSLLLPTIRSRCQQVVFQRPDSAVSTAWLAPRLSRLGADVNVEDLLTLCDGAPLRALAMCENDSLSLRQE